jgi:DNA-binding winged helix-turn-helix (wHTH) protein
MASGDLPLYVSGDLSIRPESGQVHNAHGESIRLGPVNMKVLEVLLGRAGQVVSRGEIFAAVWGNQIVGDDALTRCVSDIRAELRKLSGRRSLIETLPRRGYRWTEDVTASAAASDTDDSPNATHAVRATGSSHRRTPPMRLVGAGIAYLIALAMLGSALVWSFDRFSRPRPPIVAILPVATNPADHELGSQLEIALGEHLMQLDAVSVLSRSAIESRPSNPFPYFYFEFGARWIIESELRVVAGKPMLTVTLVDARTGIAVSRLTEAIPQDDSSADTQLAATLQRLESAIVAELGR